MPRIDHPVDTEVSSYTVMKHKERGLKQGMNKYQGLLTTDVVTCHFIHKTLIKKSYL